MFLNLLKTPTSGISPEKKFVDRFLKLIVLLCTTSKKQISFNLKQKILTYRFRRRVRRPRDEGIAPLRELLDKSLKKLKRY